MCVLLYFSYTDLQVTLKDQIVNFIDTLFPDTDWPPGKPSLFDQAMEEYDEMKTFKFVLLVMIAVALLVMILFSLLGKITFWLSRYVGETTLRLSRYIGELTFWLSRYIGVYFIIPVTFASIILTMLPDYINKVPINQIFPFCTSGFNTMIDLILGNISGLVLASYFTLTTATMLLSFPIIVGRAAMLVWKLDDGHSYIREVGRNLFAFSMISLPVFVLIPVTVLYQLIGDWQFLVLIGFNWIWSVFCGVLAFMNPRISLPRLYFVHWFLPYLLSLLALIVHVLMEHQNWLSKVVHVFLTVEFWASIMAELCISLVVSIDALVILIKIPAKLKLD